MKKLSFYLTYPFIYLISLLPFWALYTLSDFFFIIFCFAGYRKKVIRTNLKNSFPEKSDREISRLTAAYYRYLCDLVLETLKTLNMSEKQTLARCTFHHQPWLTKLQEERKSII